MHNTEWHSRVGQDCGSACQSGERSRAATLRLRLLPSPPTFLCMRRTVPSRTLPRGHRIRGILKHGVIRLLQRRVLHLHRWYEGLRYDPPGMGTQKARLRARLRADRETDLQLLELALELLL